MRDNKKNIAIVGATGAVGEVILKILETREFPIDNLYLLASERSAGETRTFSGKDYVVENAEDFNFSAVDIAFFSAGGAVSKTLAPKAAEVGAYVIDNTSQFRYDDNVPLIVPEVNGDLLDGHVEGRIIANPNCSTAQLVVALKPIYDAVGIERLNVATYQAVSGTGKAAIEELARQTAAFLNGEMPEKNVYRHAIAFNVIPEIDTFQENGYTREEMKMVWETQKIFADPKIAVNPTCVRVPVFYGHSEAVHIETREKITAEQARNLLKRTPGVMLVDEPENALYPTAISHASGQDPVYVGRVREDISTENGLNLWIVADNLRKGAALNAVQIAERLYKTVH